MSQVIACLRTHSSCGLVFAFAILCGSLQTVDAQMVLTATGAQEGFSLTTFVSGFPNGSPNTDVALTDPFGIAFVPPGPLGSVLVAADDNPSTNQPTDNVYLFTDADNQIANGTSITATYGPGSDNTVRARGLAQLPDPNNPGSYNYYLAEQLAGGGMVVQVSSTGTFVQNIAAVSGAIGIVPYPPGINNQLNNHVFVSGDPNTIYDVDVTNPGAPPAKFVSPGVRIDGMAIDPHGTILYAVAEPGTPMQAETGHGYVLGFALPGGQQVYKSNLFGLGPDGIAVGIGTLQGNLYVDDHGADIGQGAIWEVSLATGAATQLTMNGSRGDFAAADKFSSTLLVTQSDRIVRLHAPPGGGFFGAPSSDTSVPDIPTLPQWSAIAMGVILVIFSIFQIRRWNPSEAA